MHSYLIKLVILIAGLSLASANLYKRTPIDTFVPNESAPDAKNDVSDVRYLGYGVLTHLGADTHCTAIILTYTQYLVAASCVSGQASEYELSLIGSNYGLLGTAQVQSIRNHDSYDKATFANNLAIVTVEDVLSLGGRMRGIIADYPAAWINRYLVASSLSSTNPVTPAEPQVVSVPNSNSALCASYSPLFAANQDDYLCMDNTIASPEYSNCVTGYNAVVGVVNRNLDFAALYSFSVSAESNGLSSSGNTVLSYYTFLRNYIPWIESVTGKDSVGVMPVTAAGYTLPNTPITYAAVPASPAGGGYVALDGINLNDASCGAFGSGNTQPLAKALGDGTGNGPVEIVHSTETISTTVYETETEMVSAETTNVISTTTTETSTTTSTVVTTSTKFITSTSVLETTQTVVQDQNGNGSPNPADNNNIVINLNNDQPNNGGIGQTVTVTATATATLSGFTTVIQTSVQTVTASVFISESVVPGDNTIIVTASVVTAPPATTETVTTVSTEIVSSIYVVTAIPAGDHKPIINETVVSTVTEYVEPSATQPVSEESLKESSSVINVGASENISSSNTTVEADKHDSKLSPGIIAAIIAGALLMLALLGYYIWRKRKNASKEDIPRVERWMFEQNNARYSKASSFTRYARNY
ncbi:hypothetical protein GGF40_001879 [Coemansia sp. RSA 1286]|nr:hypothetical protein GGF40_001879 [Coemansia sp. RSA 1286]